MIMFWNLIQLTIELIWLELYFFELIVKKLFVII